MLMQCHQAEVYAREFFKTYLMHTGRENK